MYFRVFTAHGCRIMSPPFDYCIFCDKSVNDASLPETGEYGISMWISLCKILRVTPEESHWETFLRCRLCYSCHSLAVQSSQVLKQIESLQIELEELSSRLKDAFRGTVTRKEDTSAAAIKWNPLVTLRTFLSKSFRHPQGADDIIQVMPVWKEEFDHDDDSCLLEVEDVECANTDCHGDSNTDLEPDVEPSSSSNPVEDIEGVFRTFMVQGHVLKELEIRLERLPPNSYTANASANRCGAVGSISDGDSGLTDKEDNRSDKSWVGESSGVATSDEDESQREERNPEATVRRHRKRQDCSQKRMEENKYQCQVCMKDFRNRINLWQHNELHKGKNHACDICDSSFKTKAQLRHHKKRRHDRDKLCNLCGKVFAFDCELKQHEQTHHEIGNPEEASQHVSADDPENSDKVSHTCEFCGSVLATRKKLLHHVRYHHKEKKHVCETCGKSFYEVVALKRHTFTHSKDKPFTCELCGKAVTRLQTHKINCLEKLNAEEKNFSCSQCDKSFHLEVSLKRHEKTHLNPDRFECEVCRKKFRLKCFLTQHRRSHFLDECIPCGMCSARFKRPQELTWHMEYDHLGNRDKCSICGYEAKSRALFKVHERKHKLGNRFDCKLCEKKFFMSAHLRRHRRTHEKQGKAEEIHTDSGSIAVSDDEIDASN